MNFDENLFSEASITERCDRYFILADPSKGAKIRSMKGRTPLCEIKVRSEIKGRSECWTKEVNQVIEKGMIDVDLNTILLQLDDKEINQYFTDRDSRDWNKTIDVYKIQRKIPSHYIDSNFPSFSIELVSLK